MSNRVKHRQAALVRRVDRMKADLPPDPSNRARKPRQHGLCPNCGSELRNVWQIWLHVNLGKCTAVAS